MAKEKTDATSLFSVMNKNRIKSTDKVKEINETVESDLAAQKANGPENDRKKGKQVKNNTKEKDKEMTESVDISFDNNDNITSDIKSANPDPDISINKTDEGGRTVAARSYEMAGNSGEITQEEVVKEEKKDKELQHIHIALPKDVFEKLEIAKKAYYNNKTTYIRNLILNDYEQNREYYDRLPNIR